MAKREVNTIYQLGWRAALMLLVAWVAVACTFFVAFLYQWWKHYRSKRTKRLMIVDCPRCDGLGTVRTLDTDDDHELCPLCNGRQVLKWDETTSP
jgi:hypothetical protein